MVLLANKMSWRLSLIMVLPMIVIHQLFMELLTAGSDTSTSTIEWAMAELIKNVESMKKVQEELEIELSENDYLKESQLLQIFRPHPPAPLLLPHRAIETCQVMSHTTPKDAQVLVNVCAIMRDPLIWEDPEMFRTQSFLSSDMDFKGNDFEFLPFGAGRRICPGLPMAAIKVPLDFEFISLIGNFLMENVPLS